MKNLAKTVPNIYVITAITKIYPRYPENINDWMREEEYRCPEHLGSSRCMGWFPTLEEAEIALKQNAAALYKAFEWFVIEETTAAFYSQVLSRACYCWDQSAQNYIKTSEPECLKDYPNLGLG